MKQEQQQLSFLEELQSYEQLLSIAKEDLKTMYLNKEDKGHWAVAWSGGKDSTCVLKLITEVVMSLPKEQRNRHIYAVMSDTVVENPELDIYMNEQVKLFNFWAEASGAPFSAHMVERPSEQGYFMNLLGKGYPLPSNSMRWCTDRLKIKPQEIFLTELAPTFILSGVRRSESRARERTINKFSISDKIANYASGKLNALGTKVFMPIVHFDVEDVWRTLRQPALWSSTSDIRRIYKDATGECGFSNPKGVEEKGVEVCGARFGCWTCPVIVTDRSTEQMAKSYDWMKPLTKWREFQLRVYGRYVPIKPKDQTRKMRSLIIKKYKAINHAVLRISKAGFGRNGQEFKLGAGTLTMEVRKLLLEELLKTQDEVNRIRALEGLPAIHLIKPSELQDILDVHKEDEAQRKQILKSKSGITFNRKMLLENADENYIDDIVKFNDFSTDEIADLLVENFKNEQFEFPSNI
jgi:DNA sulfur modification protein DndC